WPGGCRVGRAGTDGPPCLRAASPRTQCKGSPDGAGSHFSAPGATRRLMRKIPFTVLLKLRHLTVRARSIPGAVLGLETIRRAFARRPEQAIVTYDRGLRIEVRIGEHMGSHLFWYGAYNRDLLALLDRLLRPGMVVLDIGANIGEIALACAARIGAGGVVYAFEPSGRVVSLLRRNIGLNPSLQLEVVEQALGDHSGRGQLY